MAKNKTCVHCGANLDFGERCTCRGNDEIRQSGDNRRYYRTYPEYSEEQKLEALRGIQALVQ